jgi:hypothetical protein
MDSEGYIHKTITRVAIIDDQPDVRDSIAEKVEDANFTALPESGDVTLELDSCIEKIQKNANAAIFDCHLSHKNYATFNGIHAIKKMYLLLFPALLITSYANADLLEIQQARKYIPIVLQPETVSPDIIIEGFKLCQNEFAGVYSPERRPWRSLVRVEDFTGDSVYVVVPSWDAREKFRVPISMFPFEIRNEKILGMRFFSKVNIGAEDYHEVYLDGFELVEKPKGKYASLLRG